MSELVNIPRPRTQKDSFSIHSIRGMKCLFLREWISIYGAPEVLSIDNGRHFISGTFDAMCGKYGIQYKNTTPYYPPCNGKVERFHFTMENAFRSQATDAERTWLEDIQQVMTAFINAISEESHISPAQAVFGTNLSEDIICLATRLVRV